MDPEITDAMLIAAARKRLLDEIGQGRGGGAITNNVYGGGIPSGDGGGMLGGSGPSAIAPEDRDYFVDILREELQPGDLVDGEPMTRPGWRKKVHRWSGKKKVP